MSRNNGNGNRNLNSKNNRNRSSKDNCKGKNNSMAIVHVAFKSSSKAPPAAAHAEYIAREGQYHRRGGVELVESGNMPAWAEADPHRFWAAADAHERANGRTYTELQIALPRELNPAQREELARTAAKELLGERFAYTLAIHAPLAKDNIDQPHLHLMFSERAVDEATRAIPEEHFFKRNGAKKDPAWNDRNKPEEVRAKWVEMMNGAMERAGIEQRMDARSWAGQGREDLAALREEKMLGGDGPEAVARREVIEEQRRQRAELPAAHLDQAAAVAEIEREAEAKISKVERWRDEQLARLNKAIAEIKTQAQAALEAARGFVQRGVEAVRERVHGPREIEAKSGVPSPPVEKAVVALSQSEIDDGLARQLEQFRAMGRAGKAKRERREEALRPKPEPVPEQRHELELERNKALKKERDIEREGYGHGW